MDQDETGYVIDNSTGPIHESFLDVRQDDLGYVIDSTTPMNYETIDESRRETLRKYDNPIATSALQVAPPSTMDLDEYEPVVNQ